MNDTLPTAADLNHLAGSLPPEYEINFRATARKYTAEPNSRIVVEAHLTIKTRWTSGNGTIARVEEIDPPTATMIADSLSIARTLEKHGWIVR